MRILHVTSEIYPLVKTGGLGDVAAALPAALAELGEDVRVLLPGYPAVLAALQTPHPVLSDSHLFGGGWGQIISGRLAGVAVPAYVLDCGGLFWRSGPPYNTPSGHDWPDNHRRFAALGWAAAQLGAGCDPTWRPAILHGHDWQTGLAMAYPALAGGPRPGLVTTIHNLAFQGWFPATILGEIGLPLSTYHLDGVEFHGGISFLKAALQYADRITTVSHTYAEEIQRPESGFGLDGLLRARRAVLSGIVNGIDNAVWNPTTDPVLPQPYDRDTAAAGKAQAKMLLQQELGLEVATDQPLIVLVGRLTVHKGAHLLAQAMPDIVAAGAQLAVLGTGAHDQEAHLRAEAAHWPHRVAVRIGFDERLAHLFQAAADITLVPSLTEPCGLTQLYAQHYGSLPLVRRVGGLADTVVNAEPEYIANHTATGFLFNDATPAALAGTVRWALDLYRQHPEIWVQMRDTAMQQNFGWEQSARAYQALYQGLQSR